MSILRSGPLRLSVALVTAAGIAVTVVSAASSVATAASPGSGRTATVWLCRPGMAHDPCTASLETTVVSASASRQIVDYPDATHPAVDCFYVYPLVSLQSTANTNLRIDPQETAIAELEASPFSRVCRVFAPMYREATIGAVNNAKDEKIAYESVLGAWRDYLAHDNHGRGVVLIGHSEGADQLDELIADAIDANPGVRKRLVSAILTGTNLTVGSNGRGPFDHIGACRSASQTGCVVAFNAFSEPPPADTYFGRAVPAVRDGVAQEELCTNPATLATGGRTITSQYRTHLATDAVAGSVTEGIFGSNAPTSATAWIQFDDEYTARCVASDETNVLMVTPLGHAPVLTATPTADWGLHVDDPNLVMGDLVQLVQSQAAAYARGNS